MEMPGRNGGSGDYRFGFQGQEVDDEVKGKGNSVNYKYRMHDPRLGRFFAVDPLAAKYAYNSPYAFSENSLIAFVELEGLEKESYMDHQINLRTAMVILNKTEIDREVINLKNEIHNAQYRHLDTVAPYFLVGLGTIITGGLLLEFGGTALLWAVGNPYTVLNTAGTVASAIDPNPAADYTPGLPGDDVLGNAIGAGIRSLGKSKIARFTLNQIDEYVTFSTHNDGSSKVMLGMWDDGGASSYVTKAGDEFTYFSMNEKWAEAASLVNNNSDEIWRINKEFLNRQLKEGKELWFSHDPFSAKNQQYFAREVNFLIDKEVKEFKKVGDLWKAVWE